LAEEAKPAVRVELNPLRIGSLSDWLGAGAHGFAGRKCQFTQGLDRRSKEPLGISATDQLLTADKYSPLIVAYSNGAPVRLSDIAKVSEGFEDVRNDGFFNGEPGVGHDYLPPARG
jgi:multidrug efflux pump